MKGGRAWARPAPFFLIGLFAAGLEGGGRRLGVAAIGFVTFASESSPIGWTRYWPRQYLAAVGGARGVAGATAVQVAGSDSKPTDWGEGVEAVSIASLE